MKTTVGEALLLTAIMAALIFICRACAFVFFREKNQNNGLAGGAKDSRAKTLFLDFVKTTVPPLAMTVLAFNAITGPIHADILKGIPVLIASVLTVIVHLWRRNPLLSIFGGTAAYMALERLLKM